jgi:crotonobetainyl-CoA:carnitine CoA-transferase CaiB-like acyl-CoA transferase
VQHIFDGIRVLDFSQMLAGPTISRFFAEMGAEVIKVELPPAGDASRGLPYHHPDDGRSGYYVQQNRGKRSVCVDPKDPAGRELLVELLPHVDVVIESFSPGTIDRLGFGWETVHRVNPRIVMVSVSAFGQEGPLADKPGYDNIAQAYSAITSMIGEPDEPPPLVAAAVGDVMTGVHGFGAVAAALYHRERTGAGQYVEVSLLDSYFHCHEINVQAHSASGGTVQPTRSGSHHFAVCPFGIFRAGGGHVVIGVITPEQWIRLCELMGRTELAADPRFADNAARCGHRGELVAIIEEWLTTFPDLEATVAALESARVPTAPVLTVAQAVQHPHLRERRTVRRVPDRSFGELDIPGFPLRFSAFPAELELHAPYLGEHNREVLIGVLGVDPGVVDELTARGVLRTEPVPGA